MPLAFIDGLIRADYMDNQAPHGYEFDNLVLVIDTALQGALQAIGAGIIEGFATIPGTGLSAQVAAGQAVLDTSHELVYVRSADTVVVDLTGMDDSTIYLWLVAEFETDYDSRTQGVVQLVATTTATPPSDSLAICTGSTSGGAFTVTTDTRVYCAARQANALGAEVAALETAVGTPYTNPLSIDTRLTTQEATGGSDIGGFRFYDTMPRTSGDPTPPPALMDEKDAALRENILAQVQAMIGSNADNTTQDQFDVDAVNQSKALLEEVEADNPHAADTQVDAVTIVFGVFGDGSDGSPDYIDRINSTWL